MLFLELGVDEGVIVAELILKELVLLKSYPVTEPGDLASQYLALWRQKK
jgi:hypothetical protein